MRIKHLLEGLNAQQRSVPQLPAQARARHISVLGAKTDPKHPFAGYMVGADESAEPGKKSIGPDRNDPYEKGWRAQPDAANPYPTGTPEHAKWQDGRDEKAAQPRHYDEGIAEEQLDEKCWDGYEKKGMKNMFGKRVPNCVKNEGAERNEMDTPAVQAALAKMAERHKGEKWSKEQLAALGKRIAARGQKTVKEDVTKEDVISKLKAKLGDYLSDLSKEIKSDPDLVDKLAAKAPGDQMGPPVKTITTDDGHEIQIHGNEDDGFRISIKNKPAATRFKNLDEAVMACEMYCAQRRKQTESADYVDEAGKDACYNKVKSRYKIWPSAYASGALVQCRKAGADNWGNKSKK
jgi:hypothetical protein